MKRGLLVFLRMTFILLIISIIGLFALRYYYIFESKKAITEAVKQDSSPIIGNSSAPFPLVDFFDYRCSHCSTLNGIITQAVGDDSSIKIILRPAVITGAEALRIAAIVLAADRQRAGASVLLHKQIMARATVPTEEEVKTLITGMGLDAEKAEKEGQSAEIQALIKKNNELIKKIGFPLVPALVIGDKGYFPRVKMPTVNEIKLMILDAKPRVLAPTK